MDPLGDKVGGAETFIKGLIKYAPKDFEIELVGISSKTNIRENKKWVLLSIGTKDFKFLPLFCVKNENKKTAIPLSLRFTMALKFAALYFNKKVIFFNRIEPAIVFRKNKYPKIAVIHSDTQKTLQKGSEVFWRNFPQLYFIFEKIIFNSLDYIYTVSKNTLKFYQLKYSKQKNKFSLLPTWVDTEIFFPSDKPKEKIRQNCLLAGKLLPSKGRWILFVGRLQEVKAPVRLVQTFAEYNKLDKESYLLIIGKGDLEQHVKNYVQKLGLENFVYFLGYKTQLELAEYYRVADALLLTSNFEGMPLCVLEALGCGLPVVTTDVGEVKRVVRNSFSGEVIESFSPEDIAKALEKVISHPYIYSKENCSSCVIGYTPEKILAPVYEMIRTLSNRYYK